MRPLLVCIAGAIQVRCLPGDGCDPPRIGSEAIAVELEQANAPLLGDHVAELTWTIPQRTTALHLEVLSNSFSPIFDCDGQPIQAQPTILDRGWSHRYAAIRAIYLRSDLRTLRDSSWRWAVRFERLRDAMVTPDWALGGFSIHFETSIVDLEPVDSIIEMAAAPDFSAVTIGTVTFQTLIKAMVLPPGDLGP